MCEIVIPFAPLATTPFPPRRIIDNLSLYQQRTIHFVSFFLFSFCIYATDYRAIIQAITFPTIERGTLAIDHHGNTAGAMLLALRLDASPRNHRRVIPGSHSWPSEWSSGCRRIVVVHKKLRIVYARSCDKKTERLVRLISLSGREGQSSVLLGNSQLYFGRASEDSNRNFGYQCSELSHALLQWTDVSIQSPFLGWSQNSNVIIAIFSSEVIKYPRALFRTVFVIVNNIYCVPTYLIWMFLLLPLKKIHESYYYKIEGVLFHWLLANVTMWSYTAGYDSKGAGGRVDLSVVLASGKVRGTPKLDLIVQKIKKRTGIHLQIWGILGILDFFFYKFEEFWKF